MIMTSLSKKDNPCIDCINRRIGCHGSCSQYKEFKIKMSDMRKKEKEYHSTRSYRTADIYQNGYSIHKNQKKSILKSISKACKQR